MTHRDSSGDAFSSWKFENNNPVLRIDTIGNIHGRYGIRSFKKKDVYNNVTQRHSFRKDSWQRFCFRLDSMGYKKNDVLSDTNKFAFINYKLSDITTPDYQSALINFYLFNNCYAPASAAGEDTVIYLCCLLTPSADKNGMRLFKTPIRKGRFYCIETELSFFSEDSGRFAIFLDGKMCVEWRFKNYYPPRFFDVSISSSYTGIANWALSLDGFLFSKKRGFGIPDMPANSHFEVSKGKYVLMCDSFSSRYEQESISETEWVLYNNEHPRLPLYRIKTPDPFYHYRCVVPFPLDSGTFFHRTRRKNNFGNWSLWSQSDTFRIQKQRELNVRVNDLYFLAPNSGKRLSLLKPGEWFEIHMDYVSDLPVDSFGYALVWLTHSSDCFGSPADKGGMFLSATHYVMNFSLTRHENVFFEKAGESLFVSKEVPRNTQGVYIDASPDAWHIDTATKSLMFTMRLLPNALPGLWKVSAIIKTVDRDPSPNIIKEEQSNYYLMEINVANLKSVKNDKVRMMVFVAVGCMIILLSFLFVSKRQKTPKAVEKAISRADFEKINDFIIKNCSSQLTPDGIQQKLGITRKRYRDALKNEKVITPDLLNKARVEMAIRLMKESPDKYKKISTLAVAVGFSDHSHFSSIFKKYTGASPNEYRENLQS